MRVATLLVAVAFAGGAGDAIAQPIAGVTIGPIESSQWPGRGYGTESSARLLEHLKAMGATWVAITPFGRIAHLQSTQVLMSFEAPYPVNRRNVAKIIAQAKAHGLKVLLVPHLWVEQGGWRGDIDPGTPERWHAYKRSFGKFIVAWARVAGQSGADAFSVGVECKSWSWRYENDWNALIDKVRTVFKGKLTYSGNWDEAEQVVFWDRLDWIGINAFYPLADRTGASDEDYKRGALRWAKRVDALSSMHGKPVVLTEIGYTTRSNAAIEPWLWPDDMDNVVIDEREQARAYDALLAAFVDRPSILGFFVWRYYADLDDISQEAPWGFSPHAKAAQKVIERYFRFMQQSQNGELLTPARPSR